MKVIAQTHKAEYSRIDNRWLVEVSEQELNHIAGKEYGPSIDIKVGTEINASDVFRVANKIIKEQETVKRVAGSLRAIADVLETVEPTVREIVTPSASDAEVSTA